jgi:hypothetical protein
MDWKILNLMLQGREQETPSLHCNNWVNKFSLTQGYRNQLVFNLVLNAMRHRLGSPALATSQLEEQQLQLASREFGLLELEKVLK